MFIIFSQFNEIFTLSTVLTCLFLHVKRINNVSIRARRFKSVGLRRLVDW